jgi:hypothetical protein
VKRAESQLHHTIPKITLNLYAQAVSADRQEAHNKVVQMMLPTGFPEQLKERSTAATAQELRLQLLWVSGGARNQPC